MERRFRLPPMVFIHNGLTYDKINPSALQATTSRSVYKRVHL